MRDGYLVSGPDIISRGFVYVKESEELMEGAKAVAEKVIATKLGKKTRDWADIKNSLREETAKFIYKETKRKPMILAVLMEV